MMMMRISANSPPPIYIVSPFVDALMVQARNPRFSRAANSLPGLQRVQPHG